MAPHFDYSCVVWDTIGIRLSDRLQRLQNKTVKDITGRKKEHGLSALVRNKLGWKSLNKRRTMFVASLKCKITRNLEPKARFPPSRQPNWQIFASGRNVKDDVKMAT